MESLAEVSRRPWGSFKVCHAGSPLRKEWVIGFFSSLRSDYPWLGSGNWLLQYRNSWIARIDDETPATVKIVSLLPGKRLSLQYHTHRSEEWFCLKGQATAVLGSPPVVRHLRESDSVIVPLGRRHRLSSIHGADILELALGEFDEEDIVRIEDDYGRTRPSAPNDDYR